jgi:hypothetical protein
VAAPQGLAQKISANESRSSSQQNFHFFSVLKFLIWFAISPETKRLAGTLAPPASGNFPTADIGQPPAVERVYPRAGFFPAKDRSEGRIETWASP